jgi:hypothetical protein
MKKGDYSGPCSDAAAKAPYSSLIRTEPTQSGSLKLPLFALNVRVPE